MGPHRKLGIYVGYKSPSIIKYLEPLTADLFIAHHADCIFDEEHFLALGGDFKYQKECPEIDWNAITISASDPRTQETKLQVRKIINLQHLANNLPDSFTDLKGVTKSWKPARNVPERVEVPIKTTQLPDLKKRGSSTASDPDPASRKQQRRERRKSSKSVNASQLNIDKHLMGSIHPVEGQPPQPSSSVHTLAGTSEHLDSHVLGNHKESSRVHEISTNYIDSGESFNHKSTIVDTYFSATIADTLLNDHDPRTIVECEKRSDWPKWKEAIQAELASLNKRKAFTEAIPTPPKVFPVGFKWVFL
jgi:hypothetical protein